MHVKEINPEKTPELFFMPRDTGEVDEELNPIYAYDLDHDEDTTLPNGKALKRRAKSKDGVPVDQTYNARIEKITGKSHFFVDLYYDGDLVATWELIPEYWDGNSWEFQQIEGTIEIDNEIGQMICAGVQGGFSWDMELNFSRLNSKWHWNVIAPGFTVRAVWEIVFTTLGQQMVVDGDLKLDYSDYAGSISDDAGTATRRIVFEEAGIDATNGWIVDPYLSIEEDTAEISVICDGFTALFKTGQSNRSHTVQLHNTLSTPPNPILAITNQVLLGAVVYYFDYSNTDRSLELLENTPTRVVIRQTGNLADTSNVDLTDSDRVTLYFYVYSDRIVEALYWDTSGAIPLSTNYMLLSFQNVSQTSNESNIYDNAGAEGVAGLDQDVPNANYLGYKSDEIVVTMIGLDNFLDEGDASWNQQYYYGNVGGIGWHDGDIGDASPRTHRISAMMIIDSPMRENDIALAGTPGEFADWDNDFTVDVTTIPINTIVLQTDDDLRYICHTAHTKSVAAEPPNASYWFEYRKVLGDQYKDTTIADPDDGDQVIDLVKPKTIGVDNFAADAAWHYTPDATTHKVKQTYDRTRMDTKLVLEDFPFLTGTVASPTDHLIGHWKCDDNLATTVLVDEIGNFTSSLEGGDNTEDKSELDAVGGRSLVMDGVADYLDLGVYDAANWREDFTIIFKCKPQFGYLDAIQAGTFHLKYNYNSFVYMNFDPSRFESNVRLNGVGQPQIAGSNFASDAAMQRWITLHFVLSLTNGFLTYFIDGVPAGKAFLTGDVWGGTPVECWISRTTSGYGEFKISEVKLYDKAILPYGAIFTGNGSVDTAVAHKDILFHLDFEGANETERLTDKINSVAGTLGGAQSGVTSTESKMFGSRGFDNVDDQSNIFYPVTAQNIINHEAGAICLWLNVQVVGAADFVFGVRAASDSTNRINGYIQVDTGLYRLQAAYRAADTHVGVNGSGAYDMIVNKWYWVVFSWVEQEFIRIHVDGLLIDSSVLSVAWNGGTAYDNLRILGNETGSSEVNAWIDGVFITSDPNTPQIWTALGAGPRHMPIREKL